MKGNGVRDAHGTVGLALTKPPPLPKYFFKALQLQDPAYLQRIGDSDCGENLLDFLTFLCAYVD